MVKNDVANAFLFLQHGKHFPKSKKSFKMKVDPSKIVTAQSVFGKQGILNYMSNGHGVDNDAIRADYPEADWDVIQSQKEMASPPADSNYLDYMSRDSSRVNQDIDLPFWDEDEKWMRSPFSITSKSRAITDEQREELRQDFYDHFQNDGNLVWIPIISLRDYGVAEEFGLFSDEDYEAVVHEFLPKWFRSIGLDANNMLWTCDYHNNTDNPHLHFVMMEKNQTRTKGKLNVDDMNNFRAQMIRAAKTRSRILGLAKNDVEDSRKLHKEMDALQKEMKEKVSSFLIKKLDEKISNDIYTLFQKIDEKVDGGKLSLNSKNMSEFRPDVLRIVDEILTHPQNKDLYEKLKDKWKELDRFSKGEMMEEANRYQLSEDKKLHDTVGNMILKSKKDFDQYLEEQLDKDMEVNIAKGNRIKDHETVLYYQDRRLYEMQMIHHNMIFEEDKQIDFNYLSLTFKDAELEKLFEKAVTGFIDGSSDYIVVDYDQKNGINRYNLQVKYITDDDDAKRKNDTKVHRYTEEKLLDFMRCTLNNLQDGKASIEELHDLFESINDSENIFDAQKIIRNTIWDNRDQPDNPYYRPKQENNRVYYENWLISRSAAAKLSEPQIQSNNFAVISVFQQLSIGYNRFGEDTKLAADEYWRQEMNEHEEKVQEENYVEFSS